MSGRAILVAVGAAMGLAGCVDPNYVINEQMHEEHMALMQRQAADRARDDYYRALDRSGESAEAEARRMRHQQLIDARVHHQQQTDDYNFALGVYGIRQNRAYNPVIINNPPCVVCVEDR